MGTWNGLIPYYIIYRGKKNFAIKREQRQVKLDSAEREQSQDRKAGLKEKGERMSGERFYPPPPPTGTLSEPDV